MRIALSLKRITFIIIYALIVLIFSRCEVKDPLTVDAVFPNLSDLTVADTLYLKSDAVYPVSVRVIEPQGWDDIKAVRLFIFSQDDVLPVLEDTMKDDGDKGDIIPQDGVFFGTLTKESAASTPGTFRVCVVAEDLSNHVSDTLFKQITAIDEEKNLPPLLSEPIVTDSLTVATLDNAFFSVRVEDPQGLDDIDSVYFLLYPSLSPVYSSCTRLYDNGSVGDSIQGDGIFSFQGNFTGTVTIRGLYTVRFQAIDNEGEISPTVVNHLFADIGNDPPKLIDVIAPDNVSRSAAQPFLISVSVTDPQGLSDIKRVAFNTYKPDGTSSSGNPFVMVDDGTQGDILAGDGKYSLTITITPENSTGDYRFEFFAEDFSEEKSNMLTHIITVVD